VVAIGEGGSFAPSPLCLPVRWDAHPIPCPCDRLPADTRAKKKKGDGKKWQIEKKSIKPFANMQKLKISREEAEQLFEDDLEDYIGEEGEQMTEKAKDLRRYEKADKPKKDRKPKERKVDQEKGVGSDDCEKSG
jgi:hypothetical protein